MTKKIVKCTLGKQDYLARVEGNSHTFLVDEPVSVGGGG